MAGKVHDSDEALNISWGEVLTKGVGGERASPIGTTTVPRAPFRRQGTIE